MSRPSINKSVVLAAALVLSFGAAGEADAQRRIPIRKDAPPPRDTVFVPAATPNAVRDTVWVIRQDTVNMSRVDTVVMIQDRQRNRLGGLYFGIGGGASLPVQDWADIADTGFDIQGTLGWQAPNSPWGVRFDLAYDRWLGQSLETGGAGSCPAIDLNGDDRCDDLAQWSAMLDMVLNFPVGSDMLRRWRPEIYVMGGGGVHYLPDIEDSEQGEGDDGNSKTRFGVNGGAGVAVSIGMSDLFFETRYGHTFRDEFATDWTPVVIGFRFSGIPFVSR
jgi:opacity protein-like surface antigen